MPRIYKISRTGLKFIYKVRYHRGHGIHSPFVFNLVNRVIEEKLPYYAYSDIEDYVCLNKKSALKVDKTSRLLFRMVNYFGAKKILEIGAGEGINTLYLTASSSQIICHSLELHPSEYKKAKELYAEWNRTIILHSQELPVSSPTEKQDCVYINLKKYKQLNDDDLNIITKLIHSKTFLVVEGIRTNRKYWALWNKVKGLNGRTVVLDLFNIGIIFFNPELYPWEYKISF